MAAYASKVRGSCNDGRRLRKTSRERPGPNRTEPKGFFFFFPHARRRPSLPRRVRAGGGIPGRKVSRPARAFVSRDDRADGADEDERPTERTARGIRGSFTGAPHRSTVARRLAFGVWVFLSERLFVATLGFGCVFRPLRADSSSHVSDTDRLLPRAETLLVAWGSPSVARRRAVRGRVPSKKIF